MDGVLVVVRARNAIALSFALNGLLFASLVSRLPDVRADLGLDNGSLGLLLLATSAGSMVALPSGGWLIGRLGETRVVRFGAGAASVGLAVAAIGATVIESLPITAGALFVYGIGFGSWDVAMNVEGAQVERRLGRTVMPRFHGGWSLGSIVGAIVGIPMAAASVPMALHVGGVALIALALVLWSSQAFLPRQARSLDAIDRPRSAWREPRTLAVGVMVLAFAVAEGSANDWLALGLIDGYGVAHWVGVVGFSVFVTAMTLGRVLGPLVLDRFGRAPVLAAMTAATATGIILVVRGDHIVPVGLGIVVWGFGASLGFPVGMSAASDEPSRAAARVSVVSTIGYGGFLAGPPLLGQLGDEVGVLGSLLVVAALMVPAAFTVRAARAGSTSDMA